MYKNEIKEITQKIEPLLSNLEKDKIIISIDGMTGAGKTTLTQELSEKLNAQIFHADDFLLPPSLRTEERYNEPGGNIHYEHMKEEVIDKIKEGKINDVIKYKPFNYIIQDFGEEIYLKMNIINIVEGSYCLNPYFGKYYDICIFMKINEKKQIERLTKREPIMINDFINKWIPLEKKYHEAFKLYDKCDIKFEY